MLKHCRNCCFVLLFILLFISSAFSQVKKKQPVNLEVSWSEVPDALAYTIKFATLTDVPVLERTVPGTAITCALPEGHYKIQVTVKRKGQIVIHETRWMNYHLYSPSKLVEPKKIIYTQEKKKSGSYDLHMQWGGPQESNETVIIFSYFKNKGQVYTGITGRLRIKKKPGNEITYVISEAKNSKYELLGESDKPFYTIRNLNPYMTYTFGVKAMDSTGESTLHKNITLYRPLKGFDLSVKGDFVIPTHDLWKKLNMGGGIMLTMMKNDVGVKHLNLGCKVGAWFFGGKEGEIERSYLMPVLFSMTYAFELSERVTLHPVLSPGIGINTLSYDKYTNVDKETKTFVQPMVLTGLVLNIGLTRRVFMDVTAEYGALFEKSTVFDLAIIGCSVGIKL